jgi:UDPglucose 6-dehydrogenase
MTNEQTIFGILGYGFVGKATHIGLLNKQEIAIHDPILNTKMEDLKNSKYIFVCIPTSTDLDIEILIQEIVNLKNQNANCQIIIRSTVPVGTCEKIQNIIQDKILYVPEFLRERHWDQDCFRRPLIVGHDSDSLPKWLQDETIVECSTKDAEVLKMFNNNYAALRVVFANQLFELANRSGADYAKVVDMYSAIKYDQTYFTVDDTLRGFGGKCLPKDLDFLISTFKTLNIEQTLFDAIKYDNTLWPTTVRKS